MIESFGAPETAPNGNDNVFKQAQRLFRNVTTTKRRTEVGVAWAGESPRDVVTGLGLSQSGILSAVS